ncbi:MAG: nicotinate phosphoribosyltransferase [Cellulomonadaceae bacterium]|nr:nicotinate phosphoribosyltransferase [Cellulomonadaceae bacterium]
MHSEARPLPGSLSRPAGGFTIDPPSCGCPDGCSPAGEVPAVKPPAARANTALLTDKYELTMLQAALADGNASRHCVFECFTRRLAPGRRYGVVAGTGRLLEALAHFKFNESNLEYLGKNDVFNAQTIDYLANYRFTGDIWGYAEGEIYFPYSPILQVEGSFAEACILETLILSVLNYDSAVASAASRMTAAAHGRPCIEMGSRRANEQAAVAAARAAVIAGFVGTSNLEAGKRYGLNTVGTAAHSFTLLHDNELSAFKSQVAAFGPDTTLLVDTYDLQNGVENAVKAGGAALAAVRIDSGDLGPEATETRNHLDQLGAKNTKITVTSDLNEYAITELAEYPIDTYGVGTSVVTGSGAVTCEMVYKLTARTNSQGILEGVAKTSPSKGSQAGRKNAGRRLDGDHKAVEELVFQGDNDAVAHWRPGDSDVRPLLVPLVSSGAIDSRWIGAYGVHNAIERHAASRAELPAEALDVSPGEPIIPTTFVNLQARAS